MVERGQQTGPLPFDHAGREAPTYGNGITLGALDDGHGDLELAREAGATAGRRRSRGRNGRGDTLGQSTRSEREKSKGSLHRDGRL